MTELSAAEVQAVGDQIVAAYSGGGRRLGVDMLVASHVALRQRASALAAHRAALATQLESVQAELAEWARYSRELERARDQAIQRAAALATALEELVVTTSGYWLHSLPLQDDESARARERLVQALHTARRALGGGA